MIEHFFTCPYCWQNISMLLDDTVVIQTYIEDCEVCCNPIEVKVHFEQRDLINFEVYNIQ